MTTEQHEKKQIVFENEAWYKEDHDKEQEFHGILKKVPPPTLPPHSGVGPQVIHFYELLEIIAPQLPDRKVLIYSHGTTNSVLDTYINWEVKLYGKLTKNELWPGYIIPIKNTVNPGGPIEGGGTVQPGGPIEYIVFADQAWYKEDKDHVQEWTGTLEPYTEFNIPPGGGHGPVVTLFYQLSVYFRPPIILSQNIVIYSHNTKNAILDQFLNKGVRIIGKYHDGQIWPGFLLPWSPSTTSTDSAAAPSSGSSNIVEPKLTVFADEKSYKEDHNKQQEWKGKLEKYEQFKMPPHSGIGPQVTLFYKIDVVYAPQLPIVERIIYSDNTTNPTLDKYLNHEVLIIGKVTNQNEIYPGYLIPLLNLPPGTVSHSTHGTSHTHHTHHGHHGGHHTQPGGPIEFIVFADKEWYKEDKDKVQEWTGTLQPYKGITVPPGGGPGPVENLFYQLHIYFPPIEPIEENIVIYTDRTKNKVLDEFLNKDVRIIGKYHDGQIWPGYLLPWSPPSTEPAGTSATTTSGANTTPSSGSSNIVEPRITVFADEATYKKDHNKQQEWKGKLQKYEQFKLPPHSGVGPQVTLFYKIDVVYAPQLPIVERIIYSDNTTNPILDKYLNHEVQIIGKITNKNEIYPGYLIPLLALPPGTVSH